MYVLKFGWFEYIVKKSKLLCHPQKNAYDGYNQYGDGREI